MIKKRSFEYDAFGPWLYLIQGAHKLPPLFTGYEKEFSGAEMCFKVPRYMDRCDANPDMNLYDQVIGIFDKEIIIAERKTRGREEYAVLDRVDSDQITSVSKNDCLLTGTLTIHTVERSINIPYNTVSEKVIDDAISLIRSIIPNDMILSDLEDLSCESDNIEIRFVNIINKIIQLDRSFHLIAYQPNLFSRIPRDFKWEFLNRFKLTEQALTSFVLLTNSRELIIVHRHFFMKRKSTDSYVRYFYYIPFDSITSMKADTLSDGISGVALKTKSQNLFFKADFQNQSLLSLIENINKSCSGTSD